MPLRYNIERHLKDINKKQEIYRLTPCLLFLLFFVVFSFSKDVCAQTKIAEVCFTCHTKIKDGLAQKYVHFPFKQGKCDSCHDLHASDHKGLMKDKINSVCISCHSGIENIIKKGKMHGALKAGNCTDCHYAHSGDIKNLLVRTQDKICWNCHENIRDQLKFPYAHVPFNKAECSSCHNAHGSIENYMFIGEPRKVCSSCHSPRCNVKGVSISAFTKDMDCTSCHSGHNSKTKGLFGPYGHSMFLEKSCESCHNPVVPGKRLTTIEKGENLCFMCHPKETTEFRDGDIHLTFRQNPCTLCHVYHASKKRTYMIDETYACLTCHDTIEKKTGFMQKKFKVVKKTVIKDNKCYECHKPGHSIQPQYMKGDRITVCARCHTEQHRVSHPIGKNVIDPRNGQDMHCMSCHSMHSAGAEFMLTHERRRALCIQCHKFY